MDKVFFDNLINISIKLLIIILIAIIFWLVIKKVINKIIIGYKKRNKKTQITSLTMLKKIIKLIIILIALILCMFMIPGLNNFSWTILSGAGIATLILGYAAQDVLSNFFGGLGITFTNPFEIGDFIKIVDVNINGYVEDISLRHTVIRTIENKRMIIPNSKMNSAIIQNYNYEDNDICRFAEFNISYESDVDLAMEIIKEEMSSFYNPNKSKKKDIEFPKVRVINWGDSSIVLRAWVWGENNSDTYENIFKLYYNVKKRFDAEKIEIPYQHINVIMDKK